MVFVNWLNVFDFNVNFSIIDEFWEFSIVSYALSRDDLLQKSIDDFIMVGVDIMDLNDQRAELFVWIRLIFNPFVDLFGNFLKSWVYAIRWGSSGNGQEEAFSFIFIIFILGLFWVLNNPGSFTVARTNWGDDS